MIRHSLLLIALVITTAVAHAQPSARATLSRDVISMDEAVELSVEVFGALQPRLLTGLAVGGLQIQNAGMSYTMRSGRSTTTVTTITYLIQPEREGAFIIPSLRFEAHGEQFQTQPLALKVEPARSQSATGGQSPSPYFAEIYLPKKSAYLGETIPVELRLHVEARTAAEPTFMPVLDGDGFTKTKMLNPRDEMARRGGRDYRVWVFRTAITPSKAGKITIGPTSLTFDMQVPRAQRNRRRDSLFNLDIFLNPLAERQRLTATVEAVELDVKPVPSAGRPPSFSGAVGEFKFHAQGSPARVKVGDPVTMRMIITGRGNFDRIAAPALKEPEGWRAYPATSNFEPGDELGLSGTKTFEMAVVPETNKTAMPQFEFSYFDPVAEKYVTVLNDREPLLVQGTPAPAAPPRAVVDAPAATPPPKRDAPAAPADIIGIRYDLGKPVQSFEPLYTKTAFVAAQCAPAAGLLVFLGWRRFRRDETARRLAALRKRRAERWRRVQHARSTDEFYDAAVAFLKSDAALVTGGEELTADADSVKAAREVDDETAAAIQQIFDAQGERIYAGAAPAEGELTGSERNRLLHALNRYEKCHARH